MFIESVIKTDTIRWKHLRFVRSHTSTNETFTGKFNPISWLRNSLRSKPLPELGTKKTLSKVMITWRISARAEISTPWSGLKYCCDDKFHPGLNFYFLQNNLGACGSCSHLGLKFHFDYTHLLGFLSSFAWAEILSRFLSLARIFSQDWNLLLVISPFISRWFLLEPGLKFTFKASRTTQKLNLDVRCQS